MANINDDKMTGNVNVPGALHSTADDDIVVYTGDVYDEVAGKTQRSINYEKVNVSDIQNNLTSTDIDKPLSANQGKELNDKIDSEVMSQITAGNLACNVTNTTLELNFSVGNNYKTFLAVNGDTLTIQSLELQS